MRFMKRYLLHGLILFVVIYALFTVGAAEVSHFLLIRVRQSGTQTEVTLNSSFEGLSAVMGEMSKIAHEGRLQENVRIDVDEAIDVKEVVDIYKEIKAMGFERIECYVEVIDSEGRCRLQTIMFGPERLPQKPDAILQR